jgi:hypothetical protein
LNNFAVFEPFFTLELLIGCPNVPVSTGLPNRFGFQCGNGLKQVPAQIRASSDEQGLKEPD